MSSPVANAHSPSIFERGTFAYRIQDKKGWKMSSGKIRVLKRIVNQDLIDQYHHQTVIPCPVFDQRKDFLVQDWSICLDGFCEWAWTDMQKKIELAHKLKTVVACCTDGFRPVIFEIQVDSD